MCARLLSEADVRALIGPDEARECVRAAFAAVDRDAVTLPEALHLDLARHHGEAHAKGAWLHDAPDWAIKIATGFYDNPQRGLPTTGGISLVFAATTGRLETLICDGGYLTELRTGAAGALAAELLAGPEVREVAIIGAGSQARYQLEALLRVRAPKRVVVYARRPENALRYAAEMTSLHSIQIDVATSVRAAVGRVDLVVTTTPSREPLLEAAWLRPGTHVTAVGADAPGKHELAPDVLARAAHVVVDDVGQCERYGDTHAALKARAVERADLIPLGALASGRLDLDREDEDITVADLTGVGAQDAAVAGFVARRAAAAGAGALLDS